MGAAIAAQILFNAPSAASREPAASLPPSPTRWLTIMASRKPCWPRQNGRPATSSPTRDYLPSVAARAWRWTPEMLEVAGSLQAQHLPPDLALATASILEQWARYGDQQADLDSILQQLHAPR